MAAPERRDLRPVALGPPRSTGAGSVDVPRGPDGAAGTGPRHRACHLGEGDALVAVTPGAIALCVLTADCAPLALGSPEGVFAAVHAGWRGLVAGVVERGRAAHAGPGGHRRGRGARTVHPRRLLRVRRVRTSTPSPTGLRRRRCGPTTGTGGRRSTCRPAVGAALGRAGADAVDGVDACTACGGGYFSHRARADAGRQALVVWSRPGGTRVTGSPATPSRGSRERLADIRARIEAAVPRSRRGHPDGRDQGFRARRGADRGGRRADGGGGELRRRAGGQGRRDGRRPRTRPRSGTSSGPSSATRWPRLAPLVPCWQGVARAEEGRAIARRRPGATVLVQVDVAGLPGRGGVPAGRPSRDLVAALRDEDLDVAGLMAVGPPGPAGGRPAGLRQVPAPGRRARPAGALHGHDRRPRGGPVGGIDDGPGRAGPVRRAPAPP